MQALLLVAVLFGMAPDSWCSEKDWDEHPQRCLKKANLQNRFSQWQGMVHDISGALNVPMPAVRPGGLHDSGEWRMEVWHIGEGQYELRIRPQALRDASDDTLLAISAHEACHIVHGDAGYGTWDTWSEQKKKERQRVAWACAFAIVGEDVIGVYLDEAKKNYTPEQKSEVIRTMEHDAQWWLDWRQKEQKVVP